MSSSLNSRTANRGAHAHAMPFEARRALLLALLSAPLLAYTAPARAVIPSDAGLQRWGSGRFRRLGILVYEATLWAGDDPRRPPLALRLDYKRSIAGKLIAEASVKEMRRFGSDFGADEAALRAWGEAMQRIFPDVRDGDHIVGIHHGNGVRFYHNDRPIGAIDSPGFAATFFAIWLDARTSAPELRAALLQRPEA